MNDKRYNLLSYSSYTTGRCPDGRQVVMGLLCPNLVTVFFDADGHYLDAHVAPWEHPAPKMQENGPFHIDDPAFAEQFQKQMCEYQTQIGFSEGRIGIHPFESPDVDCWLKRMPADLDDLDPDDPDYEDLCEERDDWIYGENHVFGWAEEYWISPNGEVETS